MPKTITTSIKDLTTKRFGKLIVLGYVYSKNKKAYWNCLCDCRNERIVYGAYLRNGEVKSCGCLQKEKVIQTNKSRATHKLSGHRLYITWARMKQRISNPNNEAYKFYGKRGIKISQDWLKFNNFYRDMFPTWKKGLTIERIDVNGDYCKKNCKWIPNINQSYNRRNTIRVKINNEIIPLATAVKRYGNVHSSTAYRRMKRGIKRIK